MGKNLNLNRSTKSPLDNFYTIFAAVRDSNGITTAGIESLTKLNRRTIERHVKRMKQEGLVTVVPRKPSGNIYYLNKGISDGN